MSVKHDGKLNGEKLEIFPLKNIQDWKEWKPPAAPITVEPLAQKIRLEKDRPQTLLCHDMAGGYHDDRFVDGAQNPDAYIFSNWELVDIFVYFSHHLITIPPLCWTNAAHKHGVKVLGTIISEWADGYAVWDEILSSPASERLLLIQKLCDFMTHFGFDGWLLNVENKIDVDRIPDLVDFVRNLTKATQKLRNDAIVIWYDSVTFRGDLSWQNELNEKNRCFFDACNGIFLNYTWKPETNLKRSSEMARACGRVQDVFVGIDIFGRNCFGGGGWNTWMAVEQAKRHGLSVALFAQGWVYEKFSQRNLLKNQKRFWDFLRPFLISPGESVVCRLPFETSFDHGRGKCVFKNGSQTDKPYGFRMHLQQPQASSSHHLFPNGKCQSGDSVICECCTEGQVCFLEDGKEVVIDIFVDETDAFNGGSSQMLIVTKMPDSEESVGGNWHGALIMPYFWTLSTDSRAVKIIFVFKRSSLAFDFCLELKTDFQNFFLTPSHFKGGICLNGDDVKTVASAQLSDMTALNEFSLLLSSNDKVSYDFNSNITLVNLWEVRAWRLELGGCSVATNIFMHPYKISDILEPQSWVRLGFFSIVES